MAVCMKCFGYCSFVLIGILSISIVGIATKEVVLLDTASVISGDLNWTKKVVIIDPPDPKNEGWNELSAYITELRTDPFKVQTSCHVDSRNVNNWLRTPFIDVQDANSLYIEMIFTMRKCIKHSDPEKIQTCQETFNLYYFPADWDFANNEMPTWDGETYELVNKIPAQHLGESSSDLPLNNVTKFVPLRKGMRGIYFAFQDTGACVSLISIKVYLKMCPNVTKAFTFFMETPTGTKTNDNVARNGTCVTNAKTAIQPKYFCTSDGSWDILVGECRCNPGYEGDIDETSCRACAKNYYKSGAGVGPCEPCPDNSYANSTSSVECRCYNHYYRADIDPKSMACTRPPSAPRDVQIDDVTSNTVQLSWKPPADMGGRIDVTYRVECDVCDNDTVMYSPRYNGLNRTNVEIRRLWSSTTYRVWIYAENGVTYLSGSGNAKSVEFEFTTESTIAEIRDIEVADAGDTFISLTWQVAEMADVEVVQYEVRSAIQGQSPNLNYTKSNSIVFKQLRKETKYEFQIRGETNKGWGEFSAPFVATTRTPYDSKQQIASTHSVVVIVGAIVAVIMCMVIALVMIFILLKRSPPHFLNRNRRSDGKNSDIDGPYQHVLHCPPLEPHINGSMTVPLFQPSGTIKSYVDPHTYEDPNQAVREFTREIDASHIIIETVIGGGEFGDVCKGKLRVPSRPEMSVAIKTLKAGATDKNRLDFLTEASIMGQFDDPNVIFLEGVVTKTNPIMIVTEYMANGSLDSFLRKNDGQLTVIQLVGMMRGIASGMRYLSEMGYVHRDLAARNILCNESLVCKVADFGLSREVDIDTTDGAYTTKGGKIPVRWTAPEAITFRKFTSASDVWSFGVVMWEVISYGERPYWNWSNQDVMKAVDKGYRLPPPMECPEAIHQLMLDTWQKERGNRPKFVAIVKSLDKLIRAPELLRKMAKPRPHVIIDNTPPEPTSSYSSIDEWLTAIKMERYIENFTNARITTMDQVTLLTLKDLDTIGVKLLGHQKKIMNSIQTLRAQFSGPQIHLPHMQGFLV